MSDYDRVLLDPETGEIIELPDVPDRVTYMKAAFVDASLQAKEWTARRQALSRWLVARGEEGVPITGAVSIRHRTNASFDTAGFRAWAEGWEFTRAGLQELVLAAKDFEQGTAWEPSLAPFRHYSTSNYAQANTRLRAAPGRKGASDGAHLLHVERPGSAHD